MAQLEGYVDVDYLRMTANVVKQAKECSYTKMEVSVGDRVLDVGCGSGTDTIALAHLVGPTGQVFGIDFDAKMLAQAEANAKQASVTTWVKYKQADATHLPFQSDEFESSRSERLFQHLTHPEKALAEMVFLIQ
jgi:ubiquinone/menaquinone biosynthesis C-methylase UbiE